MGIPRTGGHQTPTTEKHLESVGERVTRKKCDDSENKVARASAAARGVSFIVGRFFWSKSGNPCNLRGFRQQQDVSAFSFSHVFCSCFLVVFFAKVSQIPCFSCFF